MVAWFNQVNILLVIKQSIKSHEKKNDDETMINFFVPIYGWLYYPKSYPKLNSKANSTGPSNYK